jgi:hypothetical protein
MDVFGEALKDFYEFETTRKLWLHNNYGKPEDMPIDVFFRTEEDISELEQQALSLCKGKILDIGAGVGVHSLILQSAGLEVTALEISTAACDIMKSRGVQSVKNHNIFSEQTYYDTMLLLMNGIGLCGDIAGLNRLLPHLRSSLRINGQIILDSSDISYLYDSESFPLDHYYGEISYQYEYKSIKGEPFRWLYIDFEQLKTVALSHGLSCELLFEDDMDQYLARLTHIT